MEILLRDSLSEKTSPIFVHVNKNTAWTRARKKKIKKEYISSCEWEIQGYKWLGAQSSPKHHITLSGVSLPQCLHSCIGLCSLGKCFHGVTLKMTSSQLRNSRATSTSSRWLDMGPPWIHYYEKGIEHGAWPALCHMCILHPGKWGSIYLIYMDSQHMVILKRKKKQQLQNKQTNKQDC